MFVCVSTHNESLWTSGDPAFAGVGVGPCQNVPELGDDGLLSQVEVVLWTEGQVADQTHQALGRQGETGEERLVTFIPCSLAYNTKRFCVKLEEFNVCTTNGENRCHDACFRLFIQEEKSFLTLLYEYLTSTKITNATHIW